tara:strand:+ start:724 stop:909 length:186 start_codon:yes stop_codon:yes gene_type:complete
MAKKQTFGDKANKQKNTKNRIKLIRSFVSEKTGSVRFTEDMLVVGDGSTPEKTIKDFIESK